MSIKQFLRKQWPLVGLGILVVLVSFYLLRSAMESASVPVQEVVAQEKPSEEGRSVLKDIHYTQDDPDKKLKWVVDAKEVSSSGDKSIVSFHDFRLKVEPEDRPYFEIKGKRAEYNKKAEQITLWGGLEGATGNGYRVATERIVVDEKEGQLHSDEFVEMWGPYFMVKGKGFFVDFKNKTLKILSKVTTTLNKEKFIK